MNISDHIQHLVRELARRNGKLVGMEAESIEITRRSIIIRLRKTPAVLVQEEDKSNYGPSFN